MEETTVATRIRKPTHIALNTNETCNLRCGTCFSWKIKKYDMITTDEIRGMFQDLREWLGPFRLEMAGGEPFLRKDMCDILECAKSLDIDVAIVTNGSLITEKIAKCIAENVHCISLSINSVDPDVHDHMRGVKGSHALLMEAAKLIKEERSKTSNSKIPYINIHSIFSDYNKHEIIPLLKWTKENEMDSLSVQPISFPFFVAEYDPDWKEKSEFWPQTEDDYAYMQQVINELEEMRKQGWPISNEAYRYEEMRKYFQPETKNSEPEINTDEQDSRFESEHGETSDFCEVPLDWEDDHCKIGEHNLNIDSRGLVKICHDMTPIGNIKDNNIADLWEGAMAQKVREEIKRCPKECKVLLCNSKESD